MENNLLSALSLIIVFQTVAFGIFHNEAEAFVRKSKPSVDRVTERSKYESERKNLLWKTTGLALSLLLMFYLLLPNTIEIYKTTQLSFWNFDLLETLLILIEIYLLLFLLLALLMILRIVKR